MILFVLYHIMYLGQSYENFLAKMIQEYQIHNKYQVLTSNQNSLFDI